MSVQSRPRSSVAYGSGGCGHLDSRCCKRAIDSWSSSEPLLASRSDYSAARWDYLIDTATQLIHSFLVVAYWPLVGREAELRKFATLVIEKRGSVVLAGPAGVGKTRLAIECAELCERSGLAVLQVTATSASASLPFGALAPLLPDFEPEGSGRVDAKADLLRRTAASLLKRVAPRRLVFFVDDAHLLDDLSATLVHQLASTGAASVVATLRTGAPAPTPVVALWKDNLADRWDFGGLNPHAVGELLSAVLSGPADPSVVAELVERSQGNVLYLRELVIGALDSGTLCDDGGIWRLVGALVPSDRLSDLIGARLAGLTAEEMALLELVAVGEPLGATELTELGEPLIAERLERKQILVSQTDGPRFTIGFAHPLYGEVVRKQMPGLRRRVLARSLADVVEEDGVRSDEDLLRVAHWRLEAGGGRPEQMMAAATIARWRYDFALAERLARVATAIGAGFEANLLVAQLASLQGRGEEAEQELAILAGQAEDDNQRGSVAISRIDNLAFYLGRPRESVRLAEEAEAALQDPAWRDQIQARRSAMVFAVEGCLAGAEVATPLLQRAEGKTLVWAAQVASFTMGRQGCIEAGLDAAARGYEAHLTVEEPLDWYPWTHLFFRCQVLSWSGRLPEARILATEQYEKALAEHSTEAQAWFAWYYASVVAERGTVATCARHGREAVALFRDLGRPQFMAFVLPYLAMALALGGHTDEAADTLRTLDELDTSDYFMGVDPIQARAWTAVASGDLPKGRHLLEEAASVGEEIGDFVGRAAALHGLARLGHAREVQTALAREADRIEGDLIHARLAHVRALVRGDANELSVVASQFEAMSANLLAAEAAADAAVAWRRAGEPRRAKAAEQHARLLVDLCEGARTPALQSVEARAILSRAERDAAILAAAGHSNKEIANELCLSVRTVEGRLQRAYTRLGVSNRAEMAEALEAIRAADEVE